MTRYERVVVIVAAMVGYGTIWYYTGSSAPAWAFVAGAMVLGECADALARRLNEILIAVSGKEGPRP